MRRIWQFVLVVVSLGIPILLIRPLSLSVSPIKSPSTTAFITYETRTLPNSKVYILTIPLQSRFSVVPALSESTDFVETFAKREGAVAVINGGFFDPQNQRSTSYVILQGQIVADPRQNDRLTNNPSLAPYLGKIFNRTELQQYLCGQTTRYEFALHNAPVLVRCRLESAIGAGPRLLPKITAELEGFVDQTTGRDPLGIDQRNARSAIGLTGDNKMIWVMVAQKSANSGMSLKELADLLKSLGAENAMNLDGGSSSALYYRGKTIYGKVDQSGRVKRSLKSVLLVKQK